MPNLLQSDVTFELKNILARPRANWGNLRCCPRSL